MIPSRCCLIQDQASPAHRRTEPDLCFQNCLPFCHSGLRDHLDQYPALGRQCGGDRPCLPRPAARTAPMGDSARRQRRRIAAHYLHPAHHPAHRPAMAESGGSAGPCVDRRQTDRTRGRNENSVAGHASLWKAVQTVAIADVVMSLDNVIAHCCRRERRYPAHYFRSFHQHSTRRFRFGRAGAGHQPLPWLVCGRRPAWLDRWRNIR